MAEGGTVHELQSPYRSEGRTLPIKTNFSVRQFSHDAVKQVLPSVQWNEKSPGHFITGGGPMVPVYPRCANIVQQGKKKARLSLFYT